MKKTEDFIQEYWSASDYFMEQVKETMNNISYIDFDNILDLMTAYAKEAIKTDRENLLKHLKEIELTEDNFIELIIEFIKLSLPDLILEEASFKKSELKIH